MNNAMNDTHRTHFGKGDGNDTDVGNDWVRRVRGANAADAVSR